MRTMLVTVAAGVLATSLFADSAFAQTTPEVVVTTSTKVIEERAGHTERGIPIVDVSLAYSVSAAGLDLASHSGAQELERRVSYAAADACKELGRRYPLSTPSDAQCAKAATDKAMVQVREMEAAAAKK